MIAVHSSPKPTILGLLEHPAQTPHAVEQQASAIHSIEFWRSLPHDTFGHVWLTFLDQHRLEQHRLSAQRASVCNTDRYAGLRVLTGYSTNPLGNAELQAFITGSQLRGFNWIWAIASVYWIRAQMERMSQNSPSISAVSPQELTQRLWAAYWRGRRSVFNPKTWHPEFLWDLPLTVVQRWMRV